MSRDRSPSYELPPLNELVVVVTGTSQGIGAGIAKQCLRAGARVVGVSRSGSGDPLHENSTFFDLRADVTDPTAPDMIVDAAIESFGRIDGCVNNAGVLFSRDCWEQSDEEWDKMVATNVDAPFTLGQRLARHWIEASSGGTIINICSIESEIGWKSPPQAGYAATKGALLGLTRAMALDLAQEGIRVCAIGPGVIETDMAAPDVDAQVRRIPVGKLGTPEQIGDAAVFLLSSQADYVTGEILYVDGGYRLL